MSQEDIALDEKRVYADKRDVTVVYVGSTPGLARLTVSGDQTGRMTLVRAGAVRDVAGAGGYLLVATDDDVLIGTDDGLEETDFGPAVTVGVSENLLVAAGPDGEVARLAGDDWEPLGTVGGPRRFDGAYLAAEEGVLRVDREGSGHTRLGLDGVRDVAAPGPYAAADDGLYRLAEDDEWILERDEACERVGAGEGQAHLVAGGDLYERVGDEWGACRLPVEEPIADVAYGEAAYAMTERGTFLVDADAEATPDGSSGWRHRSLGLPGVTAVAVP